MRTWYIIVDQKGEEIHTASRQEAETAFSCGGIVTIVQEQDMSVGEMLIRTSVFIDMKETE